MWALCSAGLRFELPAGEYIYIYSTQLSILIVLDWIIESLASSESKELPLFSQSIYN